jgi:hypothetical protein
MKNIIPILILTVTAALVTAEDKLLANRLDVLPPNVAEKGREIAPGTKNVAVEPEQGRGISGRLLWFKSGGYLSEEPIVYRLGAEQHLAALGLEIVQLKNDAGIEPPAYFRTRVLALEQQHAYLTVQLPKLTPEEIRNRITGKRFAFDQCMGALEEAIDQAGREAGKLTKLALR